MHKHGTHCFSFSLQWLLSFGCAFERCLLYNGNHLFQNKVFRPILSGCIVFALQNLVFLRETPMQLYIPDSESQEVIIASTFLAEKGFRVRIMHPSIYLPIIYSYINPTHKERNTRKLNPSTTACVALVFT